LTTYHQLPFHGHFPAEPGLASFSITSSTLSLSRHHRSNDDCLEGKRENYLLRATIVHSAGKITHWPHPFYIHHQTPDWWKLPVLWCQYPQQLTIQRSNF